MKKNTNESHISGYAYNICTDDRDCEITKTYKLILKESTLFAQEDQFFYLAPYGEALIEKLEAKGYISMDLLEKELMEKNAKANDEVYKIVIIPKETSKNLPKQKIKASKPKRP